MGKLKNKVAIVTGASKGIGAAVATYFAAEGAKVVVNYASSKEGADKVVRAITDAGGSAIAVQGDVSNQADVTRLFAEAQKAFGSVDILVNNAGIYEYAPIEATTVDLFHRQFNINVLGSVLAIRATVEQFGPGGGTILNISSEASRVPMVTGSVYSAPRPRWTLSPRLFQRSSAAATSASTRYYPARSKPRARTATASSAASSSRRSWPKRPWAGSASPPTSPRWPSSWPPTTRPGSRGSTSPPPRHLRP